MKVKLSKYAKMSGVSVRTLWRRIKDGTLKVEYSDTGRVFINVEDEQPFILNVCIYARVSSSENKDNLERQKERLVSYCNAKGYKICRIVTEVGSGLNDERKKLESILTDKSINLIVVEHKDRLSRFGLNYIQKLLELDNRKIEIINPQSNDEDDLMQDFVSIITSFTARLYGRRRSKRLTEKIIKEVSEDNE
jgi:predicted site-specific integrase-resolvase